MNIFFFFFWKNHYNVATLEMSYNNIQVASFTLETELLTYWKQLLSQV